MMWPTKPVGTCCGHVPADVGSQPGHFFFQRAQSYVYDCGINFYSIKKFLSQGETAEFQIDLERLPDECKIYLGRRSPTSNIFGLRDCGFEDETTTSSPPRCRQGQRDPLQTDPRVLKRVCRRMSGLLDSIQSAAPILQVDPKKSAFFPPMSIDAFLEAFLPGRPGDRLERKLNPNTLRTAAKQIKGLTVMTTIWLAAKIAAL
uniref:Uncharacterized protein n=1 Tax=Ditylenchus dipsaci TaxID=166011 RepID=A0A915E6T3_9BILA